MIIDGKKLADRIALELKNEIALEKEKGNEFGLGVVLVGDNESSKIYVNMKKRRATELGINFYLAHFEEPNEAEILEQIKIWNEDPKISGIILQLPIPEILDKDKILNAISPEKDVDGLTDINQQKLKQNIDGLYPATPLGVIEILKDNGADFNKNFAVFGQSKLVGGSLSTILENMGVKVTRIDSKTKDAEVLAKNADVIISAVGKPRLITEDMIKENAVVIDVGITKTPEGLKGDVDFENVKGKASLITPVPGGVGPMTVISLMKNVLKAGKTKQNS